MSGPSAESSVPPAPPLPTWFAAEVQPHEPGLRSYLSRAFPSVRDVDDVVQESYLRIWRARTVRPLRSARAFLFKVARHLAIDQVRRSRIDPVQAVGQLEVLPVCDPGADVAQAASTTEKLQLLRDAIEALPPRCREVVIRRKLLAISQRDVAAQLGIAEKTVEAQLARGVARCEVYLRDRGVRGWYDE